MDEHSFDDLAKVVATASPRRAVLKSLAGSVAGAAVAAAGVSRARAAGKPRADGVVCSKDADCANGSCAARDRSGRRVCGCGEGLVSCDGQCLKPNGASCKSYLECCNYCFEGICQSCFIAGTRIAMANGTSLPIELVREGDRVLGRDGRANRVVGIERPLLGGRLLYAMNGGAAFVTAEHPFATEGGWKSINPAATADENPSLAVGSLVAGDRLLTLARVRVLALAGGNEEAEVELAPIALKRLEGRMAAPETQLYNLLLDGDHAYFADDFLVHNKA